MTGEFGGMATRSEGRTVRYSRLAKRLVRIAVVAAGAVLLLVAVACGSDDETKPSPSVAPAGSATWTRTSTPGASATQGGAATPKDEPFSGTRTPVQVSATPSTTQALLTDVRTGKHDTFDRITFEFSGALPGYRVEYVQPPIIADPSGQTVQIAGTAFLRIRMEPAAAHDPTTGNATYAGPAELKPGLPTLLEAQQTGDFEAVLQWVLGLSSEVDFRVTTLQGPSRLIVDVAHTQ